MKVSEVIHIRVTTGLYRKLSTLAKEDKRDLSTYVRLMIEDVLLRRDLNGNEKQS